MDIGPNVFLRTRKLTQAKEDHLTEFFAAALGTSSRLRAGYVDRVLAAYAERRGWAMVEITKVETQVDYPGIGCPDLRLTVDDASGRQHIILCEHKLGAAETLRLTPYVEGEETRAQKQLERYLLTERIEGVVYVRADPREPDASVLEAANYVRPSRHSHFLWRDFYPLLVDCSDEPLIRQLSEGFEQLGFTPPHPVIGDLEDVDPEPRDRARRNFQKFWLPTRALASELGWTIEGGAQIELYLKGHANSAAGMIWISPCTGGRFLIRLTPRTGHLDEVTSSAEEAAAGLSPAPEVEQVEVSRKDGRVRVVDLRIGFGAVLDGAADSNEIEQRLLRYVGPVIRQFS